MFEHGFPPYWSTIKKLIWLVGTGIVGGVTEIWKTVTGTLIHITDALASPMRKCEVTLEPIQAGSGDPSPDNVRPITGWTGANMAVAGANIAPSSVPSNVIAGTFSTSDSKIFSAGNARVFAFRVPKSTSIYVQKKTGSASGHVIALGDTGSIAVGTPIYSPAGFTNATGVNLNTGEHDWIYIQSTNLTGANALFSSEEFMVSVGSSRKDYEEPKGTTYPISWQTEAGTVYGGTLTVNEDGSCDLNVEWRKDQVPSNETIFDSGASSSGGTWCNYRHSLSGAKRAYGSTPSGGDSNGFYNIGDWKVTAVTGRNRAFTTNNGQYVYILIQSNEYDLTTAQGRTDYFSNTLNGALPEVWYKLMTPITYHFASVSQIATLAGENNIWADVNGEITLTYQAVSETAFSDNADTGMADFMTLTE